MSDTVSTDDAGTLRRPRRRGWLLSITLLLLIAAVGVAVALSWWVMRERERPLEADWDAVVVSLSGDGVAGMRDGDRFVARFSDPFGVAAAADGTLYVADAGDAQRIRRIAPDGTVSTLAGSEAGYADGPGAIARFDTPSGVAVDAAGNVYVADTANNAIRRVSPDGIVSTLAGGGAAGFADGSGSNARFNGPVGLAVDASGRLIVADTYNDRIRVVEPDGTVATIAGSGMPGAVDGSSSEARFDTPSGVAVDPAGRIYVADTGSGAVRLISKDGSVTTVGPLPFDGLFRPIGIAATADGAVFVTDERGRIVEIRPWTVARVVAGSRPGFADGAGVDARFRNLTGLALLAPGRLVVSDARNALLRMVVARSRIELRAPPPPHEVPDFDVGSFSRAPLLWPLAPMEGPFEVTGTLGELRGGAGTERFHAGIDIHSVEGTPVVAVRSGTVVNPIATSEFGTLNESLRIGPVTYVHLRVGRERRGDAFDAARFVPTYDEKGHIAQMRVKRGARFNAGEPVGTVNGFYHVHLNVGWPGEEHNPLRFQLVNFADTVRPTIPRRGVQLLGEDGQPLNERKKGRLVVSGPVQIVVDAWDQVDGNERRRRLGLYRLGYQVLNRDGSAVPGFETPLETIRFDRMADSSAARLIFASGSGIPFFGRRRTRFLYVVTSTLANGRALAGSWDTTALPPGDYTLRILAADAYGNDAIANRDLPVTIVGALPQEP